MRRHSDSNIVYISVKSLTCLSCHLLVHNSIVGGIATGYRLDDGGIRALEPIQPPGAVSPGVKWLTTPATIAVVVYTFTPPHTSVWHSAQLVKYRDNFTIVTFYIDLFGYNEKFFIQNLYV
jgi:hypothetical protein